MSGQNESKPANQRLTEVDRVLDEYEQGLSIPEFHEEENEIQGYFDLTRDQIEALDGQMCGIIAYRLGAYSFHLQKAKNRETSRAIWGKNKLDKIVAGKLGNYDKFMKYEAKVAAITTEDSYANSLNNIRIYAEQRSARLDELASSVRHLSHVMLANQRAKK